MLKLVVGPRASAKTTPASPAWARTNPLLAFSMTVAMLSLSGIPLTGGFFGKFFIFTPWLAQGYIWLVVSARC
ncbi:MAG: proton-conducting transporter membrane subunit [Hymenobacter sp.]